MKHAIQKLVLAILSLLVIDRWAAGQELVTYFHTDAAGSPVAATDANGNVVWREDYQPYGERRTYDLSSGNNRNWFVGQPQSDEFGLSYMGARYYDPVVGRFMGIDPQPVTEPYLLGFNRYAYSNNNPYRYSDTDGQETGTAYRVLYLADGGRSSPPPRSPDDRLGPAIGAAVAVAFAPVAIYGVLEVGIAAFANPATALSITEAALAQEALGPGTLAVTGALAARGAFDIAKAGGRHAGFLKNYLGRTPAEIQKGIASLERQIAEHRSWIANPQSKIPNFGSLDPRQQAALVNSKWPSDIARQQEQLDILRGLLGGQ